jgi:hypothetical protein
MDQNPTLDYCGINTEVPRWTVNIRQQANSMETEHMVRNRLMCSYLRISKTFYWNLRSIPAPKVSAINFKNGLKEMG